MWTYTLSTVPISLLFVQHQSFIYDDSFCEVICVHMDVLYIEYMLWLYTQHLCSGVYVRECSILCLCLQVATKSHHFHLNTCRSPRSACSGWTCRVTWLTSCQPRPTFLPLGLFVKLPPPSTVIGVEVIWWMGSDSMWPTTQLFNAELFHPYHSGRLMWRGNFILLLCEHCQYE